MAKERVLVFGGHGFIGRHVSEALLMQGYDVTVFDIEVSGDEIPGVTYVSGDIASAADVDAAVDEADIVYNYAGIADIAEARNRPTDTIRINVLGNALILDAIAKSRRQKYIFASTIYVYSQSGGFYRCSKQACETYIEEYAQHADIPYTILRYGTLYGPGANAFNSVKSYLVQAMKDGKIVCDGDGSELREYIHISDASRISVKVIDERFDGQNIIIAGHQAILLSELYQAIQEILKKEIAIEYLRKPSSKHYHITPYSYTPKAGKKLYDEVYTDLGQGLIECLEDLYHKHLD